MKISAYILANRAQEVPVPVPGEEVTTGISWSYTNPIIHYSLKDMNRGDYSEPGTWTDGTAQSRTQYQDWKNIEGAVPSDVGWHQDYYCGTAPEGYGYGSKELVVSNFTGNIMLNFSGLNPGKYVAVFDHWLGCRESHRFPSEDPTRYLMDYSAFQSSQSIAMGANGIVYGEIKGIEEYFSTKAYALGALGGIHFEQRCEFTIGEGDTSKTFAYGDDSFSMIRLAGFHHRDTDRYGVLAASFYSGTSAIRSRLYTSR